jgi:uncharacterized protein YbaP (TraB family)
LRAFGLLSGLLLCLLLGCSKPAQDQVAPPDNAGHPALWSIEDDAGHKGWLFGTIHALPKGTAWQSETLDTALRDSRMLTIEANGLDDQKAVAQIFAALGVRGGLPPLSERVAPDLRPALKAAVVRSKIPSHTLDKMESWAATLILASAFGADMGLEKGEGVEQVLIRRFKAEEKPISGLETIAGQLGIFDDLPEHEQRTMLNTMLRSGDSNQDRFEVQFTAWHDGAIEKLEQKEGEGILASPLLREKLLDGRNRDWATQIAALLAGDRGAFVAVGAAHLPGKNGVVALLENAGYRLKRLQ